METGVVVASALVKSLFEKLSSAVLKEFSLFWGVEKDLKALEKTLSTVKTVLEDAGKCYITDSQDLKWLSELKENVYDVDDLLDRLFLEAQRRKKESRDKNSRVIINFLNKRKLVKRLKLAHEIKTIKRNLGAVAADREKFQLKIKSVMHKDISIKKPVTWSIVDEGEIYGREHDKEEIMKQLMQTNDLTKFSIIAIVGMGGIGKTTLARLAYNNIEHELKGYLTMWVDVSQSFDLDRIVRLMIELESELEGNKFFLVLDDVRSDKYDDWENLKSVLRNGASVNKIIVTTRPMRVVNMMEAAFDISIFKINLDVLSDDCSTNLFNKRAFGEYKSRVDSRVRGIAEEILKKCGGIPLALNILGSIMRSKDSIEEWEAVRDSAIWAPASGGDQVMNSLKLSYMNLSPCLKECFLYCSIFPNGKLIYKLEIIDQWMAHGLVSSEYEGNENFKQLVQMSFFQNIDEQENGEVTCKIHDLIHDLAQSINHEFLLINNDRDISSNSNICCRYLSLKCLSIIAASNIIEKVRGLHIEDVDDDLIPKAKCLRSLVLDQVNNSLNFFSQELIHLRHVCISGFWDEEIPIDFCALWSLQSLHLKGCYNLRKLPESIGSAVGLRTLKLDCNSLESLPESIGQCQSLQNLIIQSAQLMSITNSIGQLENMRLMVLVECNKLKRLPDDVFENCTSIKRIIFYKCVNLKEIPVSTASLVNLENLNLSGCRSFESFPDKIFEKCTYIKSINLYDCRNLKGIPTSIGSLVNLESLNLSRCKSLKSLPNSIGDLQNLHSIDLSYTKIEMLPSSIHKLVNLETLNILKCKRLRELPSLGEMKKLRFLDMEWTNMQGMPIEIGKLTNLRRLSEFVVAKESKYARISELEHLNLLGGTFRISGLNEVSNPREVVQANLKHKKDLENLMLAWDSDDAPERDCDVAVLEALQPPSGIKQLNLVGYPRSEYSRWMTLENTSFSNLTALFLVSLEKCTHLPSLVELPSLRYLMLVSMDSLNSFTGYYQGLVYLELSYMYNLEELATIRLVPCNEHVSNNAYESAFPKLSTLKIYKCPKLRIKPHLPPSLLALVLDDSNEELLTGAIFSGEEASSQLSLPSLGLRQLIISDMELLTECQLLRQVSFLRELQFHQCQFDHCLPIDMRHFTSLLELRITNCEGLNSLPEWFGELKSLQRLVIHYTHLTCLPRSMQQLTALKYLEIVECPQLEMRCEGEDWYLISHIPEVHIRPDDSFWWT